MNKSPEQFMVKFPGWEDDDRRLFNQMLDSLTYEDVSALADWCIQAQRPEGERSIAQDFKEEEEWKKSEKRSFRRKELEKARAPLVEAWLKDNLKPGMRLKMKGCRDHTGLREFIRWDERGNLICWQIVSLRQWVKTGVGDLGYYTNIEHIPNQVTTHFPDKVVSVWVNGNCWSLSSILNLIKK